MKTSLTVEEVVRGQSEPQTDDQSVSLAIWERLPDADHWLLEDDFLERLAEVAGLQEGWKGHDLSALFTSLHAADWIEVRRISPQLRQVRRSPERPRFYTFAEQAENGAHDMRAFQKQQRETELERAEEARRELAAPQRAAEQQELAEAINSHPVVVGLKSEVEELEATVSGLRTRIVLLEKRRGISEGTEPASAG
jgi:hypothetical protein